LNEDYLSNIQKRRKKIKNNDFFKKINYEYIKEIFENDKEKFKKVIQKNSK
jgi:hypothetical protein